VTEGASSMAVLGLGRMVFGLHRFLSRLQRYPHFCAHS
jgi:hypothetical protein